MTVYADPIRAAREAGYKNPQAALSDLTAREEIVSEIRRRCENMRSIYENTAICGLYRLAYGGVSDALTLVYKDNLSEKEMRALDLTNVSEIKRTDKGIEVKFCDRIKAIDKLQEVLGSGTEQKTGSGLLDAILLSAEALGNQSGVNPDGI